MNSMILHELFFDGLGDESEPGPALQDALARDFGSYERWRSEFIAMGKALGGGSGWVLLSWSPRDRKLVNQWASDHCHTLAGGSADPGARHVRALLSHRLRRQGRGLCRHLHGGDPLGKRRSRFQRDQRRTEPAINSAAAFCSAAVKTGVHMRFGVLALPVSIALSLSAAGAVESFRQLKGTEIRSRFAGMEFTDDVNYGREGRAAIRCGSPACQKSCAIAHAPKEIRFGGANEENRHANGISHCITVFAIAAPASAEPDWKAVGQALGKEGAGAPAASTASACRAPT